MVGIIEVLAVVILPNLHKYISYGDHGAKNVKRENVVAAFKLMMAEQQVSVICTIGQVISVDFNPRPHMLSRS